LTDGALVAEFSSCGVVSCLELPDLTDGAVDLVDFVAERRLLLLGFKTIDFSSEGLVSVSVSGFGGGFCWKALVGIFDFEDLLERCDFFDCLEETDFLEATEATDLSARDLSIDLSSPLPEAVDCLDGIDSDRGMRASGRVGTDFSLGSVPALVDALGEVTEADCFDTTDSEGLTTSRFVGTDLSMGSVSVSVALGEATGGTGAAPVSVASTLFRLERREETCESLDRMERLERMDG